MNPDSTHRAQPTWIGLGAQRSGTTWLTDLLTQHPDVKLNSTGRKELHFFDRFLLEEWSTEWRDRYRNLFEVGGGEVTPSYLRSPWAAPLVQEAAPNAVTIAVLRNPVDRFVSALRWYVESEGLPDDAPWAWIRSRFADALWGGFYADQLEVWKPTLVLTYEDLRANPIYEVGRIWRALGLNPVDLVDLHKTSSTKTSTEWQPPDHVVERVSAIYARQNPRLSEWIDFPAWS